MKNLHQLSIGSTAYIHSLSATGPMRRRLLDLGFVHNAPVRCLFSGPADSLRAYLIKNTVIALRKTDAETIYILEGAPEQ